MDNKRHLKERLAERFRVICNEQIAELEDRLPSITNPLKKDEILKEIDALLDIVDQANERAEELIKKYEKQKTNGPD